MFSAESETQSIFERKGVRLTEAESELVADLLHKILRYNPEQRLCHAWFTTSSEDCSTTDGASNRVRRRAFEER
ncbi:hypothetical protein V1527DRAFT_455108, partial [Lipomyces starkeyi]